MNHPPLAPRIWRRETIHTSPVNWEASTASRKTPHVCARSPQGAPAGLLKARCCRRGKMRSSAVATATAKRGGRRHSPSSCSCRRRLRWRPQWRRRAATSSSRCGRREQPGCTEPPPPSNWAFSRPLLLGLCVPKGRLAIQADFPLLRRGLSDGAPLTAPCHPHHAIARFPLLACLRVQVSAGSTCQCCRCCSAALP